MAMQQIIVRLPEEQLAALDQLANKKHITRAKAMRDAIRLYLEKGSQAINKDAFGLFKDTPCDGLQVQTSLREEWDLLTAPEGHQMKRLGFMAEEISVPEDFDRMKSKEI